ncbi:MAG: hypothetical protein WCA22_04095 [Candidatus Binatus sp.]
MNLAAHPLLLPNNPSPLGESLELILNYAWWLCRLVRLIPFAEAQRFDELQVFLLSQVK